MRGVWARAEQQRSEGCMSIGILTEEECGTASYPACACLDPGNQTHREVGALIFSAKPSSTTTSSSLNAGI